MALLFRDRSSIGDSRRETTPPPSSSPSQPPSSSLPSPFSTDLTPTLSTLDIRSTAYEIFVAACRTSSGKTLSSAANSSPTSATIANVSSNSGGLQRSLTSTAASRVKKAFGLRSSASASLGLKKSSNGSPVSVGENSPKSKPLTVGELMRVQMRVSETVDSRIRRAFLRIAASQVRF